MPLYKSASPAAFQENIRNEYHALKGKGKSTGKAQKQAVAIAYSIKRRAQGKKK
jgi:hypothetical protein